MLKLQNYIASFIVLTSTAVFLSASPALAQMPAAPDSGASSGASYNWAGYTAIGGNFTTVSGSWTIPQASSSGNVSADAEWIGIGGISSQDLIQTGTQAVYDNGQPTYQAWYELLPSSSQNINLNVKPGDSISASIAEQPNGQWLISFSDNTTGQNFQTAVSYSSSESSAEWILEMPTAVGSGFIPLDNYGSIQFTGANATKNGQALNLSQLEAQPMTMLSSNQQTLSSTSGLGNDDASFTVSRSAVTTSPVNGFSGFGREGFRRQGNGLQGFQYRIRGLSSLRRRGLFRQRLSFFRMQF
jgi:hypothetical protein